MEDRRYVAVVDIGKTNAKLVLHDTRMGHDIFVRTEPNTVLTNGPYPHYDTDRLWSFLLDALRECAAAHPVDAISITTHGACFALVGDGGLTLPILDYESDAPEACCGDYDRERPSFSQTFSPRLPNGLNVGAQLFWLERTFPDRFAATRHILAYPQYWAWRMTGVAASELTSLGCHTDLWEPGTRTFSSLVARRGWHAKFPELRSAFARLGPLDPDIADGIGLSRTIPVSCGIHDSNASLLPHLIEREPPFTVLSTGTWIIALGVGGSLEHLDEARDTLANVSAFGNAIPSARFMGGREFDILTDGVAVPPRSAEVDAVAAKGVRIEPTFAPGTGPFPQGAGRWSIDPATLSPAERTAAASIYCAEISGEMLALIGAKGETIVEGPFSGNRLFVAELERRTGRPVNASNSATGTTAGAASVHRVVVDGENR